MNDLNSFRVVRLLLVSLQWIRLNRMCWIVFMAGMT